MKDPAEVTKKVLVEFVLEDMEDGKEEVLDAVVMEHME